jgi:hypothetical protein
MDYALNTLYVIFNLVSLYEALRKFLCPPEAFLLPKSTDFSSCTR